MPYKSRVIARVNTRNIGRSIGGRAPNRTLAYTGPRSHVTAKLKKKTRTATRTKLTQKVKTTRDGPVSDSYFTHNMKGTHLTKLQKQTLAPQFLVNNNSAKLNWASGKQFSYTVNPMFTTQDINLMYTTWRASFQVNTNAQLAAKLLLKNLRSETLYTNQSNDVVSLTLYDVVARRDITNVSYSDPYNAWHQGVADQSLANTDLVVGSTPFQCQAFCEYFKILKITKVDLHSGGHHRHVVSVSPNKIINYEIIQGLGVASPLPIGHLSHFTMAVMHGYPDNNTGGNTVSTASGSVDYVSKRQYEYYGVVANKAQLYFSDNLSTLATESIINDLTGAATTLTTV